MTKSGGNFAMAIAAKRGSNGSKMIGNWLRLRSNKEIHSDFQQN
ncbi:hypothetical protein N44_01934 [Microcystis aeruginosa NIES-44]|uniref:Uncharacterized protein n=1 Tax=Microcystis aeruginosa NIES-44 TaxID=449439 RepID=A0A0A1VTV2_MICAE|nr:hypothetical protein N44_01934 [Microcystis aeruginosa NIES-44]